MAGLLLGSAVVAKGGIRRAPAAFDVGGVDIAAGGMGTIGAMNVAVCTDASADETSTCWKDYGGICMYKDKSCDAYSGTKNSSGCGSGKCFCCMNIDSSLVGDDDAVLGYVDQYITDDDKRSKSTKKGGKSSH